MSQTSLTYKILGVELLDNTVPATAEAWDAVAGPGSCVGEATTKVLYHSHAGRVRPVIVAALTTMGFVQADKESDGKFAERCRASDGFDETALQTAVQTALTEKGITFEGTLKSEGSQRAVVGQAYIDSARQIIDAWESGVSSPEKTLAKMRAVWPGANLPADPTDEVALAKLLREIEKRQKPSFV